MFGESFGAIAQGRSQEWVSSLLTSLYRHSVYALRKRTPMLKLILAVIPYISSAAAKDAENSERHADNTRERVRKRIERDDTDSPDIFQHIIAKGGLTEDEMVSESMILITAGCRDYRDHVGC